MNPKNHPNAKKIDKLSFTDLEELIKKTVKQAPGEYELFDLKAVKYAAKQKIPLIFIDGSDPEEIIRAVEGGHSGTVVTV